MLHRLGRAGIALEDQPRDPGDLPELAPRQLGGVEARGDVVQQVGRGEQAVLQRLIERRPLGRQELEAVVVRRQGEGDRPELRQAVGEQRREPLVDQPAFDRVDEEVVPFASLHPLDQQLVGGGNPGPLCLELEYAAHRLHLGAIVATLPRLVEPEPDPAGELRRDRQARAGPVRHRVALLGGPPYVCHHAAHPDELERPPRKGEYVAGAEPGHKLFLDRADRAAAEKLHLHGRFAHDGADRQPVAQGGAAARHHVASLPLHHLAVLGVCLERGAAAGDEVEHPAPLGIAQVAIGPGGPHFGQQLVRAEAAAEGDGDRVLCQQIERPLDGPPGLDLACLERGARRGHVHQLQRVGRHAGEPADRARLVTAPPGPLDQAAHGLRAADLEHAVHRRKVHAEVEGRGTDHTAEAAVAEAILHPFAGGSIHRAVVQGQHPGPVGPRFQQCLEPELRRGARVGEDERGLAFLDRGDDLGEEPEADLPGPREALHRRGDERIHLERLGDEPLHDAPRSRATVGVYPEERVPRGVEVAQRGREPQRAQRGPETAKARQTELGLDTPLRRHQLVPLVHHDQLEMLEQRRRLVASQQERQALGRRDEGGRKTFALAGADTGGGVTGARFDRPRQAEVFDGGA